MLKRFTFVAGLLALTSVAFAQNEDKGSFSAGLETNSTYYFNDDGTMYSGWKEEGGKTYYYRGWGGMAYSMTMTIDGVPCTFNFKGELVRRG